MTGILFNHESRLRHKKFVTKKIISAACKIKNGSDEKLTLGDLSIKRDWGWAPEYVEAMWRMLQLDTPQDFIIATGHSNTLENFVSATFENLNLDWRDHVVIDHKLFRPSDLRAGKAAPVKAEKLPKHQTICIQFDLYLHDNWRNDVWRMAMDGSDKLVTGFSTDPTRWQSYPK